MYTVYCSHGETLTENDFSDLSLLVDLNGYIHLGQHVFREK